MRHYTNNKKKIFKSRWIVSRSQRQMKLRRWNKTKSEKKMGLTELLIGMEALTPFTWKKLIAKTTSWRQLEQERGGEMNQEEHVWLYRNILFQLTYSADVFNLLFPNSKTYDWKDLDINKNKWKARMTWYIWPPFWSPGNPSPLFMVHTCSHVLCLDIFFLLNWFQDLAITYR